MNDKPGGTPDHFNTTPGVGNGSSSPSRPMTNSPSNFGARPAPSAPPVTPISGGPATIGQRPGALSGTSDRAQGINSTNFGGGANENMRHPGPADLGTHGINNRNLNGNSSGSNIANPAGMNRGMGGARPVGPKQEGLNRPMMKATPVAPKQKKGLNKKLVIGIACGVVALVLIVGIAAVAILMLNKSDPVAKAMDKLVASGLPTYMTVKADVNAQMDNDEDIVSHVKVSATANMMPATLTNEANATIMMGGRNMDDTTFQVSEIYAGEDNLFVMFDGLDATLESYVDAVDYTKNETVTDEGEKCVDKYGDQVACDSDEAVAIDDGTSTYKKLTDVEKIDEGTKVTTEENCVDEDDSQCVTEVGNEEIEIDSDVVDTENGSATSSEIMTISGDETDATGSEAEEMLSDTLTQLLIGITQSLDGKWLRIDSDGSSTSSTAVGIEGDATGNSGEVIEGEVETPDGETAEPTDENTEGEVVGGETVEIDMTELIQGTELFDSMADNDRITCDIDLVQKIRNNSGTVTEIYRNNPFISGSNESVNLSSKSYPVYRIVINQEKYAAFIEAMQSQGLLSEYTKCSGKSLNEIVNFPSQMPTIYTEVDNNSNFTRFYFATTKDDTTLTMNFDLSYPANINVKEPQNYVNVQEALGQAVIDLATEDEFSDLGLLDGLEEGAVITPDPNTTTE